MPPKRAVLIIDDDLAIAQVVRAALEDEGYQVLHAAHQAAIGPALHAAPDLILLDLNLQGVDGADLSRQLRADPAGARAAIVVLSAQPGLASLVRDLPVDDYLRKPFDLDTLYAIVARWTGTPGQA
jgi:DNA-binding response OmpR family regulator